MKKVVIASLSSSAGPVFSVWVQYYHYDAFLKAIEGLSGKLLSHVVSSANH